MSRSARMAFGIAMVGMVAWVNACRDSQGPRNGGGADLETAPTISEPLDAAAAARAGLGGQGRILRSTMAAAGPDEEVAYITLPPNARPNADLAVISNPGREGSVTVAVRNGGFDPVAIVASPNEDVNVQFFRGGISTGTLTMRVPPRKAPKVVRANPPRGSRDVAINKHIVVVFSEPIEPASLSTTTFSVRRGNATVPGSVRLIDGSGVTAAFLPSAPLASGQDYTIDVGGVRDLHGEELVRIRPVAFRTGSSTTGPVAFIEMSVDTLRLSTRTYQLSALATDAAGNILADQTIAWESADPTGLSVSQTGFVTALREGSYDVRARVGNVISSTNVIVTPFGAIHSLTVAPPTASVIAEDTIVLESILHDATGLRLVYKDVSWTSSDPALATVSPEFAPGTSARVGRVTTKGAGVVTITASSEGKSGTATITITPPRPVGSLVLAPGSADMLVNASVLLKPTLRAADGRLIVSRPITWQSTNTVVATVDATGLVTAVGVGTANIIATSEGVSATVPITVGAIGEFTVMTTGWEHSCALDASGKPYCWGTMRSPLRTALGPAMPVAVETSVRFTSLSAGTNYVCGLTAAGVAYCWGLNTAGQVGNGSTSDFVDTPVAVTGALTFSSISAGNGHACGLTPGGSAYCWGDNSEGQLGNGVDRTNRLVPSLVSGGLTFATLSAGSGQTCGVTSTGVGYCWGSNIDGELGNGSTASFSVTPVPVSGGLVFGSIGAGGSDAGAGSALTCGVTTAGSAWCWGSNSFGQLGAGTTIERSSVPVLTSGGLTFSSVHAGDWHACGLTTSGAAHCWGAATQGQLGDGVAGDSRISRVPVAVTGGLLFSQLSPGGRHTCALATNQVAWCWGDGGGGQLGNGSFANRNAPVRVSGRP